MCSGKMQAGTEFAINKRVGCLKYLNDYEIEKEEDGATKYTRLIE